VSREQPPSDLSRAFREETTPLAHEVASRLTAILRNAHVHGPNNDSWVPLLKALQRALFGLLRAERTVVLEASHGQVIVNGSPLRASAGDFGSYQYLVEELTRRGAGALRIDEVPGDAEVKAFAYALADIDPEAEAPFRALTQRLALEGVVHLVPLALGATTSLEVTEPRDRRDQALLLFLRGIAAVREVMEGLRAGHSVGFRRCRRFVQAAADLLSVDPGLALALTTIKNYEGYLYNHSVNLCLLSLLVGQSLGLDRKRLGELGLSALLRHVGEATVPPHVLNKRGPLTPEEWAVFRRYPSAAVMGLLRFRGLNARLLRPILVAFEHSFVRPPGAPSTPHDVNLFSRVATLAEAYDAMTTPRPYRERPLPPNEALRTLVHDQMKAQTDPFLLKAFVRAMGLFPVGSLVLLDTREIGIVASPPADSASLARPRVRLMARADGLPIHPAPLVELGAVDERGLHRRHIAATADAWRYGINVAAHLLRLNAPGG
jgi:HD-GYP domain-containing protein (c-di-GMP phosphodiesterase class II)